MYYLYLVFKEGPNDDEKVTSVRFWGSGLCRVHLLGFFAIMWMRDTYSALACVPKGTGARWRHRVANWLLRVARLSLYFFCSCGRSTRLGSTFFSYDSRVITSCGDSSNKDLAASTKTRMLRIERTGLAPTDSVCVCVYSPILAVA